VGRDGHVYNAVALVADGRSELRFKHELPNYGVFDEKRVFRAGPLPDPVTFRSIRIGIPICEDIWFAECAAGWRTKARSFCSSPTDPRLKWRSFTSGSISPAVASTKPAFLSRT
jgi:predicted amidohydrolase